MSISLITCFIAVGLVIRFLVIRENWRKKTRAAFSLTMPFASEAAREDYVVEYCSNLKCLHKTLLMRP